MFLLIAILLAVNFFCVAHSECLESNTLRNGRNCVLSCRGNGSHEIQFKQMQCNAFFKIELDDYSVTNVKFPKDFPPFTALTLKNFTNLFRIGDIELSFPDKVENLIIESSPIRFVDAWELVRFTNLRELSITKSNLELFDCKILPSSVYYLLLPRNKIRNFHAGRECGLLTLDLHRNFLTKLAPENIPRRIMSLDFSFNQIHTIENFTFQKIQTSDFKLFGNPVEKIGAYAFQELEMGSNGKKLTLSLKIGATIAYHAFEGFWLVNPKAKIRFEFLDAPESNLPSCFLVFDQHFCDGGIMHPLYKSITVSMNLACSDTFQHLHCADHLIIDLPKTDLGFSRIINNDYLTHRTTLQIASPQPVCFNQPIKVDVLNVTGIQEAGGLCPGSIETATNELKALVLSYGSAFPYIPKEVLQLPLLEDLRIKHRINCDCSICWMKEIEARWGLHQARCHENAAYVRVKDFLDKECSSCRNETAIQFALELCAKCLRSRTDALPAPQIMLVPDLTSENYFNYPSKTPPAETISTAVNADESLALDEPEVPPVNAIGAGLTDSQIALIIGGIVLFGVLMAVLFVLLHIRRQNETEDQPK